MVLERLQAWAAKNDNKLPTNILFYRDGVSQSQYDALLASGDSTKPDGEVRAIELAFTEALQVINGPVTKPKITLIVVGKRHNTRFFPAHVNQQVNPGRNGNLKAGHLIDSDVTLVNEGNIKHNFFLQSHTAIQGTARTAHYVVLKNVMGLNPNAIHVIVGPPSTSFPHAYTDLPVTDPRLLLRLHSRHKRRLLLRTRLPR
jgi:eukaryotic translation initiation factor 2C